MHHQIDKQYLKVIWFYSGCCGRSQAGDTEEKRWDRKIEERNDNSRCGIKGQCNLKTVLGHDLCNKDDILEELFSTFLKTCTVHVQ